MSHDGVLEISCPLGKYWRAMGATEEVIVAETVTEADARTARRYYMAGYDAATAAHLRAMAHQRTEAAAVVEHVAQAAVAAERAAVAASRASLAAVADEPGVARNELSVVPYSPPLAPPSSSVLGGTKPRKTSETKARAKAKAIVASLHPHTIAVQNGIVSFAEGRLALLPPDAALSLRAGRLGPHDPIPYLPWSSLQDDEATRHLLAFLRSLFPSPEVLDYVLCAVASCLDGVRRVPNLFLCKGAGSNGKSAFQTLVSLTLGDYATAIQPELLCKKTTTDQFRKGIAHHRLIAVGEPVLGSALNATTVGTLLSVTAAHVFLFTCELPVLKADDALWSHIRVLPFETTFTTDPEVIASGAAMEADLHLQRKMPLWRNAFLSLLIDRFASAVGEPRPEPTKVLHATLAYRVHSDPIQRFVAECLLPDETAPPLDAPVLRALLRRWRLSSPAAGDLKDAEILARLVGVSRLRPRVGEPVAGGLPSSVILDTTGPD